MEAPHQPTPKGFRLLAAALSLALTVPVLAATRVGKNEATTNKKPVVKAKLKSAPLTQRGAATPTMSRPAVASVPPGVIPGIPQPSLQVTPVQPSPAAQAAPAPAARAPVMAGTAIAPAAAPLPAAATQNPYLAGWYRPVPVAALPAMAVGQLNENARYVSDALTSIPAKVADALPSIKTVHPTGGRDLVVANLKCPAEMVTGQYLGPANAMREGINGALNKLNDSQLLKFDIQLVCS
ncbi:MAG: hypothetical protein ACK4TK_00370 [Thiobacillaceae bacterium]